MQIFFDLMNIILSNLQELFGTEGRTITFGGFDLGVTRPQKNGVKGQIFFPNFHSNNTCPMVNGTPILGSNVAPGPLYMSKKIWVARPHRSEFMVGQTW